LLGSIIGELYGCQTPGTKVRHVCQTLGTRARPERPGRCEVFIVHQDTDHYGLEQCDDVIVLVKETC